MERKIVDYIARREIKELGLFLDTIELKEIKNLVTTLLKDESKFYNENGTGCFAIICALFKAYDLKDEKQALEDRELRNKKRGTIIHEIVRWLSEKGNDTSSLFDKEISDLVEICINEIAIDTTDSPVMIGIFVEITTCIIQAIQRGNSLHGKLFSFLPTLLSVFDSCNEVVSFSSGQNSTGHSMSGQDYKNYVLNKLCNTKWHTSNVLSLAGELRDIPMPNEQLHTVAEKIMSHFDVMDINGIPPLIYQMLLFSRKGQKRLILQGITEFFNRLDDEINDNQDDTREYTDSIDSLSFSQLSHMEGTVIIHMCFAITQDQELGSEFIKYMKSNKTLFLKPFNIACLLSIARIHRFEDQALDFLKMSILTALKDKEKLEKAKWISKVDFSKIISSLPLVELFQTIMQKTSFGWDQVTQSLIQLGIILMDLAIPSAPWGKVSDATRTKKEVSITPNDVAKDLGTKILLEMFKIHDMVRAEILDQIQSRVISKSSSVGYFLNLLGLVVKEAPHSLYNYIIRIKGTLDYLSFLSATTADSLLKAIQPLLYVNQSLRDGLMVILRKGLFTKELEGRQIALAGYLRLLKMLASNNHELCSTPMNSSNILLSDNRNTLSFEILGNLRKCFSQQPQLRLSLYEGLLELMDIHQHLNPIIFDILYPQFLNFFELGSSLRATFNIENCIETLNGEPHIAEPLPYLLVCLSKSITSFKTINAGYSQFNEAQLEESKIKFQTLIDQLIHSDMSEFMIDPNADFKMNSKEGCRNNMCASILLGMYEAAIEHTFFASELTSESSEIILRLFKRYTALFEVLKEKSANARGRKTVTSITENSILSFKCIAELCKFTFQDINGTEIYVANSVLRTDAAFVKYITAVAHNKISQIISNFNPEDKETFGYCTSLAQVFMNEFIKNNKVSIATRQDDKKDKGKSIFAIAIESFALLAQAVLYCWSDRLMDFLALSYPSELINEIIPNDLNEWLDLYIREFENLFITSLSERIPHMKEALGLFQTITLLASHFTDSIDNSESHGHLEHLVTWLRTLCEERAIEDTILAKSVISFLIKLEKHMSNFKTSTEIAHDMLTVLGDINGTTDGLEMNPKFVIVNPRTSGIICSILIGFMENMYEEIEWFLIRMKLMCSIKDTNFDCEKIDMTDVEQTICIRLFTIINATTYLVQTSLQDYSSEQLIKCLQKTYKVMIALIKYKIAEGGEILQHFIDVTEFVGLKLTDSLYNLLLAFGSKPETNRIPVGKKRKPKNSAKTRIARESKIIPNAVFLVEQHERYLIQLTKKSKVNLTQYIKRATNRDFKIKTDLMDELGDNNKNSKKPAQNQEAEEVEDEENNEEVRGSQNKRRRS